MRDAAEGHEEGTSGVLAYRLEDGVATLTFNEPHRLNPMSLELMRTLRDRLQHVADDQAARFVIITGAGRAFSAGGDRKRLEQRAGPRDDGTSVTARLNAEVTELQNLQTSALLLHRMPKPTLSAINGDAVGGGLSLALACDIRIAAAGARLGTAYAKVGLSGDFGISYFLRELVGGGKARELLMGAPLLSADEAYAMGLVTEVCEPSELDAAVASWVKRLAHGPTFAFGKMKENLAVAATGDLRAVLDREALNVRLAGLSDDAVEGVRAMLEGRAPRFQGS